MFFQKAETGSVEGQRLGTKGSQIGKEEGRVLSTSQAPGGSAGSASGKNLLANTGDLRVAGLTLGLGRFSEGGQENPLQYS